MLNFKDVLSWLKAATKELTTMTVNHPAPRYIATYGVITGLLCTLLPLMDFLTGLQIGLIMGSYNYLAMSSLNK